MFVSEEQIPQCADHSVIFSVLAFWYENTDVQSTNEHRKYTSTEPTVYTNEQSFVVLLIFCFISEKKKIQSLRNISEHIHV